MNKTAEQAIKTLAEELKQAFAKLGGVLATTPISTTKERLIYGSVIAKHIHRPFPNDSGGDDNENCFVISAKNGENDCEVFDHEAAREIILAYLKDILKSG